MSEQTREITALLKQAPDDPDALELLYRRIEAQLRRIANQQFAGERDGHTLQATVLVDEAFHRLLAGGNYSWANRKHFFSAAARVMRRLLVDHARKREAEKRGAGQVVASLEDFDSPLAVGLTNPQRIAELNDVIEKLESKHPDAFQVFNLHFFMGCDLKEVANDIMDIPYVRAQRLWGMARAFLRRELVGDGSHERQ